MRCMKFDFTQEEIHYVKIIYRNSDGKAASVKASVRSISENNITACAKSSDGLYIKTPQDIVLGIICKEGLYSSDTTLKSVYNDKPYTFFNITKPQDFEFHQNREFFRVNLNLECIYSYESENKFINIKTKTVDISANGVTILLASMGATTGALYLNIEANGRKIKTKVKYIRSEKTDSGYRVSLRYDDISEHDRDYISQICLQKQLSDKRKMLE